MMTRKIGITRQLLITYKVICLNKKMFLSRIFEEKNRKKCRTSLWTKFTCAMMKKKKNYHRNKCVNLKKSLFFAQLRSEERRVGKECRDREGRTGRRG